jgi:chromosome segregation ATPase
MELTQKVVRVMLQVQTQKGRLLNAFNDALVDKITRIQADTHTLDGNQRAAALVFLGELQQQVQEQIRRQDLIEQHDCTLQELIQWQFEKQNEDAALTEQLDQQQTSRVQWQDLKDIRDARTEHQLQTLESDAAALKRTVTDLDQWRQDRHKADDDLSTHIADVNQQTAQHLARISDSVTTIAATQSMQESLAQAIHARVDDLQTRVIALERVQTRRKSLSAILMRHGMSLLALGVAVAALVKALSA